MILSSFFRICLMFVTGLLLMMAFDLVVIDSHESDENVFFLIAFSVLTPAVFAWCAHMANVEEQMRQLTRTNNTESEEETVYTDEWNLR